MATIMIIEDNLIYRELLRELCESEGHEVIEFSRAEDALQMLTSYSHKGNNVHQRQLRIDMFIVDFNMDKMNGFELVRELRGLEQMSFVPILMISSTNKNMGEILKTEGVAFLPKPSSNQTVLAAVKRMLAAAPARPLKATPRLEADAPALRAAAPPPSERSLPAAARIRTPGAQPTTPPAEPIPRLTLPKLTPLSLPAASPIPPPSPVSPTPPRPPASPAAASQPKSHGGLLGSIEDGIKNRISQSPELTEYLMSRQKPLSDAGRAADTASSPVADLLEQILDSALRLRASDIHIEPHAGALDVRLRVDGVLQPLVHLPLAVSESLVARIKIVCNLNITEKRLPQDGQFIRHGAKGRTTKFRVSTLPSLHGEKVVMRVLPSENLSLDLKGVGFSDQDLALIRKVLHAPNGMILVTGPTGSGKTTTLYTMLESLNSGTRNIVTVEDPIEYQLAGITQVQVNAAIGYTFECVLRSFLRQDPDVMLVGEIRDAETAEIAMKAAVTGHLVLSTLHTNNAASTLQRLLSMGLPAYLVAAATRLVIAQRLVRVLCPKCKVPGTLSADESCMLDPKEIQTLRKIWRPKGCSACHSIGHAGRRVVMEALPVLSSAARVAIADGASPDAIEALAVKEGMVPMRRQALQLVADGTISIDEALTVLHS